MRRFAKDFIEEDPIVLKESNEKVVIKSPYPCSYEESSRIVLYTFQGGDKGTLLFIHGLGRYNLEFLKYFPKEFSKRGFSSALMILPYHFDRTPRGKKSGELFLDTTSNETLRSRFEHAVVDAITSLNYLKNRFNPPIYLMGYSFGGMISTVAAALYPELSGLSLVVTGGNFLYITWESVVTKVLRVQYEKNQECSREICKTLHSEENFYAYIRSLEDPFVILDSAPMPCYEYDPLTYAKFIKTPTVMFTALFDVFIPRKASSELYRFLGSETKKRYLLPAGHITSFLLWRRYILNKTFEFFQKVGR